MEGRLYTAPFTGLAIAATTTDVFEINAATNRPVELAAVFIGQTTEVATNVGEDEFLAYRIARGNTTSGTGGTAVTPVPIEPNDNPATPFAFEFGNTTAASGGTATDVYIDVMNVRTGLQLIFPAGFGPRAINGSFVVMRLITTPADSITFHGTAVVRELI